MTSQSLSKRMSLLAISDIDYLSGRLLFFSCLGTSAARFFTESFEKICKLIILLHAKVVENVELDQKYLKSFQHNLTDLLKEIESKTSANFDSDWHDLFSKLTDAYEKRYPESWKVFDITINIDQMDICYSYLRNQAVKYFPKEEASRAKQFGNFLFDAYHNEHAIFVEMHKTLNPIEVFYLRNHHIDKFNIDHDHMKKVGLMFNKNFS